MGGALAAVLVNFYVLCLSALLMGGATGGASIALQRHVGRAHGRITRHELPDELVVVGDLADAGVLDRVLDETHRGEEGVDRDDADRLVEEMAAEHDNADDITSEATDALAAIIRETMEQEADEALRGRETGSFADMINNGMREINFAEIAAGYVESVEIPAKDPDTETQA